MLKKFMKIDSDNAILIATNKEEILYFRFNPHILGSEITWPC